MSKTVPALSIFSGNSTPRFMLMNGSNMEPALRHRDIVAVSPVDAYDYPAIYVLECLGQPCFHRCQHVGGGKIMIMSDNPVYQPQTVDWEVFQGMVIGIVVAILKVIDHARMGL